ncbi:hypothetical protein [Vibrio parahaemolyticus]|nr:hypothetical protein [Vibrio parahaemolyticus]EGQ7830709.1 hypothetical protein [Vibrio parahaemolyticus]EGR0036488.1 hypothetical protein [Vibrio parahaemolyticus]EGR0204786.1 hypothetical protein [Vibrio parahaemolyticus]EGR0257224.1 hypothetical protein [Vibrio parahaemolyticus]EGR1226457.1 hypothetical protein [Vibrio parahaemolyticus]
MGKKEFLYSVLASIVAAAILEVSGVFSLLKYLNAPLALPVWSILALIIAPIFLSLYWFRKTKTPEHEAIIEQFNELSEKYRQLENSLMESRSHTSSLELIIADDRKQLDNLNEQLSDWVERGVKLLNENDELEQIVNQRFGPEIVELDGKEFTGCRFEGTIMKFKGTGPVRFNHDTFSDVRWVMDNPAAQAISILGAMYASGMPEMIQLVEQTFDNIRQNSRQAS